MKYFIFILFFSFISSSCSVEIIESKKISNPIPYTIKRILPHDDKAFTQGLVIHEGRVFESTGLNDSWIAEVDPETGHHEKKVKLGKKYFGEGITVLNNKMYQLTWKGNIGFIYELDSFEKAGEFYYDFEGWGITHDTEYLIISDGSDSIYYLDTLDFEIQKVISVKENNEKVKKINELEFIDGFIYANQWNKNFILKIDPESGNVEGKIDLTPIARPLKRKNSKADALNGIAYNEQTNEILVTGKFWPKAYLIVLD
ncbi:glutaminyl-peptide cyclotransferase [soil metagenome]